MSEISKKYLLPIYGIGRRPDLRNSLLRSATMGLSGGGTIVPPIERNQGTCDG